MSVDYQKFLASKTKRAGELGHEIDPSEVHPMLHPFQRDIVRWAVRKGRAAVWADAMWDALLGDSCERLAELDDDSVSLSVYSPPFSGLYVYSASPRDLGNSATHEEFDMHYSFVIRDLLRVTQPGRNSCVHVADIATTKATHGVTGLYDLPGAVITAHIAAGWIFYGRWMCDRNPQAVATRTKAQHLLFATKNRDSAKSAPATGDQLLLFKKPGENAVPIPHEADEAPPGVSNDDWILWARPLWTGIRETHTLNVALAREDADERHLHPLQLDFIERCVRLWSNHGELVIDPFGGVGSTGVKAVELGRRAWSCELKQSYWKTAVENMRRLGEEMSRPSLFDDADVATGLADETEWLAANQTDLDEAVKS